ncbi:MAG: GTP-binding protein [Acidobacteria bacterium]|nr:GTP-binding protein [Acidobacteriota bacterium]MCI0718729.1 GTP-binding protein [Acidobacteriota bacterium]
MTILRKLLLLGSFVMLCSNCQTQTGGLNVSGGSVPPLASAGTTPSSETRSGTESAGTQAAPLSGAVIDGQNQKPIQAATVFHSGLAVRTGPDGKFELKESDPTKPVMIKASGYRQTSISLPEGRKLKVALKPFDAKGLYLTHFGVSSKLLRNRVLGLIDETELNAVVIDVKGDRGLLSSRYEIPLAAEIGALKLPTIKDARAFVSDLHQRNIYAIARIVVFKDNILASAKPEWAIIDTRTQKPWVDREELAWVDPFRKEVWDYNIAIAKEAAKAGFDEIQFDYMRFPTDGKLSVAKYSQPNNMENRVKTINAFLQTTAKELLPYNVYFSGDIFGYTPWNYNDTDIGQKIEDVAQHLDYLCLMVYPSGYHLGIPRYRNPVQHSREVVYYTLEKAAKRLDGQSKKLRPWLQNFKDYAFDRRPYTGTEIKLQIQACEQARSSGYLLWDPSNKFKHTADAMKALRPAADQVPSQVAAKPQVAQ